MQKIYFLNCQPIFVPFIGKVSNFSSLSASSLESTSDEVDYSVNSGSWEATIKRYLIFLQACIIKEKEYKVSTPSKLLDGGKIQNRSINKVNRRYPELRHIPYKKLLPKTFLANISNILFILRKFEWLEEKWIQATSQAEISGLNTNPQVENLTVKIMHEFVCVEVLLLRLKHSQISSEKFNWELGRDEAILIVKNKFPNLKDIEYIKTDIKSFRRSVYCFASDLKTFKIMRKLKIQDINLIISPLIISPGLDERNPFSFGMTLNNLNSSSKVQLYYFSLDNDMILLVIKKMLIDSSQQKFSSWPPIPFVSFTLTFTWLEFLVAFMEFKKFPTFSLKEQLQIQKQFFILLFTNQQLIDNSFYFTNSPINTLGAFWQITFDTLLSSNIIAGESLLSHKTVIVLKFF